MRFATEMASWAEFLNANGIVAHAPDLLGDDEWNRATEEERRVLAHTLATNHFSKIESSDIVFVFNESGYAGPSVTLEMGFAVAHKKPMYAKCSDVDEVCRDVWFNGYCQTKEELLAVVIN